MTKRAQKKQNLKTENLRNDPAKKVFQNWQFLQKLGIKEAQQK